MEESSQDVIPQQEVETESVKRSEMCIGLNCVMMALPKNIVTGITIMIATNPILKRTQLVTNTTLKTTQGSYMQYTYASHTTYVNIYTYTSMYIS